MRSRQGFMPSSSRLTPGICLAPVDQAVCGSSPQVSRSEAARISGRATARRRCRSQPVPRSWQRLRRCSVRTEAVGIRVSTAVPVAVTRSQAIVRFASDCSGAKRPLSVFARMTKHTPLFTIRQGVAKLFFPGKKASAWTVWFSARSGRNAIAAEGGITGAARHLGQQGAPASGGPDRLPFCHRQLAAADDPEPRRRIRAVIDFLVASRFSPGGMTNAVCETLKRREAPDGPVTDRFRSQNRQSVPRPLPRLRCVRAWELPEPATRLPERRPAMPERPWITSWRYP